MKTLKSNISRFFNDAKTKKAEACAYAVATEILNLSATYVPVDTSLLINSKYGPISQFSNRGVKFVIGYKAEYAAAVHGMSGKLKGQPRANFGITGNRSKFGPQKPQAFGGGTGVGNYWDPDGKPRFLSEAGKEIEPMIGKIIKAAWENE